MATQLDPTAPSELEAQLMQARAGTAHFGRKLDELTDEELGAASLLPGWTRRHVVAHIGSNGWALARLVDWAATGVENGMFESGSARDEEIERGANLEPGSLRDLYDMSAVHLDMGWRALSDGAWDRQVRTLQGREIAVAQTVWMRTRELWVHAVDLRNGAGFRDIPIEILEHLLAEVMEAWRNRGDDASIVLRVTDLADFHHAVEPIGDIDGDDPEVISGSLAGIVQWACGRGAAHVRSNRPVVGSPPRWL